MTPLDTHLKRNRYRRCLKRRSEIIRHVEAVKYLATREGRDFTEPAHWSLQLTRLANRATELASLLHLSVQGGN